MRGEEEFPLTSIPPEDRPHAVREYLGAYFADEPGWQDQAPAELPGWFKGLSLKDDSRLIDAFPTLEPFFTDDPFLGGYAMYPDGPSRCVQIASLNPAEMREGLLREPDLAVSGKKGAIQALASQWHRVSDAPHQRANLRRWDFVDGIPRSSLSENHLRSAGSSQDRL